MRSLFRIALLLSLGGVVIIQGFINHEQIVFNRAILRTVSSQQQTIDQLLAHRLVAGR